MRYIAAFHPQAWVSDGAIEVDFVQGPTQFDVTEAVTALSPENIQNVLAKKRAPWDYNDDLRRHPNAPDWVRDWSGPFEIHVQETP